jgi:cytochrome c oxidase cbb3-type subunit 4
MSPFWGHAVGVLIVLMMATFIGIWVWAWLPRHQCGFGRMARLPMDDGGAPADAPPTAGEERR